MPGLILLKKNKLVYRISLASYLVNWLSGILVDELMGRRNACPTNDYSLFTNDY